MPLMDRVSITPENEAHWLQLRKQNISSTESAALFGLSPYKTAFELWHSKKDDIDNFKANTRTRWGNRLEAAIARGVADDYSVAIRNMRRYITVPDAGMGSSYDYEIWSETFPDSSIPDNIIRAMRRDHGPGLLEIKNVDYLVFNNSWTVDKETKYIEAPAHIEAQVQHQLHVADREWAVIAAFVGGNDTKVTIRRRDRKIGKSIQKRIIEFWKSIDENNPPPVEMPEDASFLASLFQYAEPGKVVNFVDESNHDDLVKLCQQYKDASEREALAKEDKSVAKALLLQAIGDAERAMLNGFSISAGMVGPAHIEYDREPYRGFRVTTKKPKGDK